MGKAFDTASAHDEAAQSLGSFDEGIDLARTLAPLRPRWRLMLGTTLATGALGYAASFLIPPQFTSTTTFLPPQQQSAAASALASLGALSGLLGGGNGMKSPADQYISLMQSTTVADRMIDRFHLMTVYDKKYRHDARKALANSVTMTLGKKDGLISVAVEDESPQRAASMANQYVEELRRMTSTLAVSEAQQRRVFFEKQMLETKERLTAAQTALEATGFAAGALKAEPKAAAEQYAQLRAQAVAAEVKLQTLRNSLAETSPQVAQQVTLVNALRSQIADLEAAAKPDNASPNYVGKYREFKYQETLFDLLAKQYELARVDEAREGALIQVVDPALPSELKSSPKRLLIAVLAALGGFIASAAWVLAKSRGGSAATP
jgi:uncharacterized protein involved in exopolysaccharide biosynthesis